MLPLIPVEININIIYFSQNVTKFADLAFGNSVILFNGALNTTCMINLNSIDTRKLRSLINVYYFIFQSIFY